MSRRFLTPRSVARSTKSNRSNNRCLIVEALESRCLMSATPMDLATDQNDIVVDDIYVSDLVYRTDAPIEALIAETDLPQYWGGSTNETNAAEDLSPIAALRVTATDEQGNPVDHVEVGDKFFLNVAVEDVRANPQGVFAMYFDLLYDSALMEVVGEIDHTDTYPSLPMGDMSQPGIINESGGFSNSLKPLGGGALGLYSIPMRAISPGNALIAADPADCGPITDISVYGIDETVAEKNVTYGETTIEIGSGGKARTFEDLAKSGTDACSMVTQVAPPVDETEYLEEEKRLFASFGEQTNNVSAASFYGMSLSKDSALQVLWLSLGNHAPAAITEVETARIPLLDSSSPEQLGTPTDSPQSTLETQASGSDSSSTDESVELLDKVFAQLGDLESNLAII